MQGELKAPDVMDSSPGRGKPAFLRLHVRVYIGGGESQRNDN